VRVGGKESDIVIVCKGVRGGLTSLSFSINEYSGGWVVKEITLG
jgi:hypothetical protein